MHLFEPRKTTRFTTKRFSRLRDVRKQENNPPARRVIFISHVLSNYTQSTIHSYLVHNKHVPRQASRASRAALPDDAKNYSIHNYQARQPYLEYPV